MVSKVERFEMRVDETLLERVDAWRAREPGLPSRSEAIRRLVEAGLERAGRDDVRLTDGEKLIVMMLCDLYKHGKVKGDLDPEFLAAVIHGGHSWAFKLSLPGLFHGHEDTPSDLKFVLGVLGMWDAIERDYLSLTKKERARVESDAAPFGKAVRFPGFDGNYEAPLALIAHFLVNEMGRFSRFKGRELNAPVNSRAYKRMLNVFEAVRGDLEGRPLSVDEIVAVLRARGSGEAQASP